ncbi:MAG: hypothetical protein NC395_07185 [Prevotella sp.]|nr:hypothetical protein [Prevotella sp.]
MEQLKNLIEKTSDAREEYTLYIMALVRGKPELMTDILNFLKENPASTSAEIMNFTDDFLFDENGELLPEFRCDDIDEDED